MRAKPYQSIITLLRDNICPDSKVTWAKYFMRSIITLLRDNICPGQKLLGLNILCDQ